METHRVNYIKTGNLQVAASCETQSEAITAAFYPVTLLLYTQVGQLNVKIEQQLFSIPKDSFGLLRKYTECSLFKTWDQGEPHAKTYVFALPNEFIRQAILKIDLPKDLQPVSERFIHLPNTALLDGLMKSLIAYVDEGADLAPSLVESKTFEALHALVSADKNLAGIFREFSRAERADLEKLMNNNFLHNISLQVLATESGRSLSTFNRDFRAIFNEAPHQWIKRKRILYARNLMVTKRKKPSEVYLEVGFEDLAHFSRSFKKLLHVAPAQFYQSLPSLTRLDK